MKTIQFFAESEAFFPARRAKAMSTPHREGKSREERDRSNRTLVGKDASRIESGSTRVVGFREIQLAEDFKLPKNTCICISESSSREVPEGLKRI